MKLMAQRSWTKGEPLSLVELPTPPPRPNEVCVAAKAIGVNPVDWKMREMGPLRVAARLLGPPPPVVVGVDFAGVVEAVGSRVSGVAPGDRVVGGTDFTRRQRGSYADHVFVRADQLCPLPDEVDFETAAALPVAGVTAWISLVEIGRLRVGRKALVLGASGGVGHLAVQLAKHERGASVVGVCSEKNVAFVKELGADLVLDYGKGDPLEEAARHGPYQVVMDCVGSYPGAGCRALLGSGGRHVIVSGDSVRNLVELVRPPFTSKTVLGQPRRKPLERVVTAVAAGRVRVEIAHRLPLAEAEESHRLSRSGRIVGKIVLVP